MTAVLWILGLGVALAAVIAIWVRIVDSVFLNEEREGEDDGEAASRAEEDPPTRRRTGEG